MNFRKMAVCATIGIAMATTAKAQSTDRDWAGAYGGVHLGFVYADYTNAVPAFPGPTGDAGSAIGGVQLGYNWQRGETVYGAELDLSLMELEATSAGGRMEENNMAALRFRVGQVVGETLFYGSLGVAWTEKKSGFTGGPSTTDYDPGLMVGGGAERWLRDGVTGKLEAFYVDVPKTTQPGPIRGGSQNLIFRAGLNLHF